MNLTSVKINRLATCFYISLIALSLSGCGGGGGETQTPAQTQKYGTISVSTDPSGAAISLDGAQKGTSPLTLEQVPAGSYKIKASKSLYAATEQDVVVQENKTTTVTLVLNADTSSTPNPPPFAK